MNELPETALAEQPPAAFCFGWGQHYSHAHTLSSGKTNAAPYAGTNYHAAPLHWIASIAANPDSVPKEKAPWIIPSSYTGFDARTAQAQEQHGQFQMLCFDIDSGNLDLQFVNDQFTRAFGGYATIIYSTRSSTFDNKKWRVMVPLARPHTALEYKALLRAMNDVLEESCGITVDRALEKPSQLIYLPNKGDYYEFATLTGPALDVPPAHLQIAVANYQAELRQIKQQDDQSSILGPLPLYTDDGAMNVITALNHQTTLEAELLAYGCKQRGYKWLAPGSTSGQAGIIVHNSRRGPWEVCYCFHDSEPNMNGRICDPSEVRIARMLRDDEAKSRRHAIALLHKSVAAIVLHEDGNWYGEVL
jgi:hypothetical protein